MHALRNSSTLARLILVWFVLALGVAVASPLVHPKVMELVCSVGSSAKLVALGDNADGGGSADQDGSASSAHSTLDCPLCLAAHAPPRDITIVFESGHPLAHALQPVAAAHIAALVGAPLPARGPPTSA